METVAVVLFPQMETVTVVVVVVVVVVPPDKNGDCCAVPTDENGDPCVVPLDTNGDCCCCVVPPDDNVELLVPVFECWCCSNILKLVSDTVILVVFEG